MLGVFANNHDYALTLDNLAFFADRLYGWSDFHGYSSFASFNQLLLRQVIRPLVRS